MYIRRGVVDEIGMFDDDFFLYLEDVEFCLRANRAGFDIVLQPNAVVWHRYRLRLGVKKLGHLLRGAKRIRGLRK